MITVSTTTRTLRVVLVLLSILGSAAVPFVSAMELTLQTRDSETGEIQQALEKIDPRKVGVVAVNVWNFHWCKAATMRVDAIVPRLNKALEAAREMGMTVMLCPSDVVDNYAGFPQREAIFALPKVDVPVVEDVRCPPVPDAGGGGLWQRTLCGQLWMECYASGIQDRRARFDA